MFQKRKISAFLAALAILAVLLASCTGCSAAAILNKASSTPTLRPGDRCCFYNAITEKNDLTELERMQQEYELYGWHPQGTSAQVIVLSGNENDPVHTNLAARVCPNGGPNMATVVEYGSDRANVTVTGSTFSISGTGAVRVSSFGSCGDRCAIVTTPEGAFNVTVGAMSGYCYQLNVTKR